MIDFTDKACGVASQVGRKHSQRTRGAGSITLSGIEGARPSDESESAFAAIFGVRWHRRLVRKNSVEIVYHRTRV